MIDLICKLIFLPFTLMAYMFKFMGYFLYAIIICFVWAVQFTIKIIKFIIYLFSKKNYRPRYVKISSINDFKNNDMKNNEQKKINEESYFDREADLWGLSNEDRRIAKEERMTPADFIEAEERADDVLDTDEWE